MQHSVTPGSLVVHAPTITTQPSNESITPEKAYEYFVLHARRVHEMCKDIAIANNVLPPDSARRLISFVRLFETQLTANEQGQVYENIFQLHSQEILYATGMDWLRGQPFPDDTCSSCCLQIGKAYLDLGAVYSWIADRANHANKLMDELQSTTPSLMDHVQTPLVLAYNVYSALAFAVGTQGENAALQTRLLWLKENLGDEYQEIDETMQKAEKFLTPIIGLVDSLLAQKVEQNESVPDAFRNASARFRGNLHNNSGEDVLTRFSNALQGTLSSQDGQGMMNAFGDMLDGSSNPALKRFMSSFSQARTRQEMVDKVVDSTSDVALMDELIKNASEFGNSLVSPNQPSERQQAANQQAASFQTGEDFPVFS